jgi:phosphohistidine swiveling domain-containing protein
LRRIESYVFQKNNPKADFKHVKNIRVQKFQEFSNLLKKLKISKKSQLYRLIEQAKDYAFLRTWRTDVINKSGYLAKNFFAEIAKRADREFFDIQFLTFFEVKDLLTKGKLPISEAEFKKRKIFFGTVLLNGEYRVFSGNKWKKKLNSILKENLEFKDLKGNIVFLGKVIGRVKIVKNGNDISKVERGDILVAIMTFPNFVPAMEKAAAFVTDEGGILCHAAIVAREMRKPCIIGTKIATKVLKDGDLVEVDAENGIVRKL